MNCAPKSSGAKSFAAAGGATPGIAGQRSASGVTSSPRRSAGSTLAGGARPPATQRSSATSSARSTGARAASLRGLTQLPGVAAGAAMCCVPAT